MSSTKTLTVEEAKAQVKAANLALNAAVKAQFDKVKNQFRGDFLAATESFLSIPTSERRLVWKDKELVKAATKIGLKPFENSSASAETQPAATDENPVKNWRWNDETKAAVLEFVGATGKLQSEIIAHFNSTSTTVIKWGKALSAANLIEIDDTKRSNFWELVKS